MLATEATMNPLALAAINSIRSLSMDAVQKANSGHPGLPMGAAPMAYVLWQRHLKHSPRNPRWPDRDRFVLSAGHGCMIHYALLHLTDYESSRPGCHQQHSIALHGCGAKGQLRPPWPSHGRGADGVRAVATAPQAQPAQSQMARSGSVRSVRRPRLHDPLCAVAPDRLRILSPWLPSTAFDRSPWMRCKRPTPATLAFPWARRRWRTCCGNGTSSTARAIPDGPIGIGSFCPPATAA